MTITGSPDSNTLPEHTARGAEGALVAGSHVGIVSTLEPLHVSIKASVPSAHPTINRCAHGAPVAFKGTLRSTLTYMMTSEKARVKKRDNVGRGIRFAAFFSTCQALCFDKLCYEQTQNKACRAELLVCTIP
jgi:hypothetical protein